MALEQWSLWEIGYQRDSATVERPVSDVLSSSGRVGERAQAIGAYRLLRAHGWPGALQSLDVDKVATNVFRLKRKPGCWRIYFHVLPEHRFFLLLHAVCKKKQKREASDTDQASRRLADYQAGRAQRHLIKP